MEFRPYAPDDLGRCLDLIRAGHDADFSERRFRWLHEEAPAGPSSIALAVDGGRVVGIYSVVPRRVRLGDAVYRGGRDVDPVVHADYRGQGLFPRLLAFGLEHFRDFDFCYNFANPASARGFRKAGWQEAARLDDRVFRLGPARFPTAAWCQRAVQGLLAGGGGGAGAVVEIEAAEAAQLLADDPTPRPLAAARLQVVRDAPYLRWRYLRHPLHEYRYFRLGAPPAWALVVTTREAQGGRVYVVDAADFGLRPVLAACDAAWTRRFPRSLVTAWSPLPAAVARGLVGNPRRRGQGLPFLVRPFPAGKPPAALLTADGWTLTRGDLEIT